MVVDVGYFYNEYSDNFLWLILCSGRVYTRLDVLSLTWLSYYHWSRLLLLYLQHYYWSRVPILLLYLQQEYWKRGMPVANRPSTNKICAEIKVFFVLFHPSHFGDPARIRILNGRLCMCYQVVCLLRTGLKEYCTCWKLYWKLGLREPVSETVNQQIEASKTPEIKVEIKLRRLTEG